jgi:hypothetical protein
MTCKACGEDWLELLDDLNETENCDCGVLVCMNCASEYDSQGVQLSA